MRCALRQCDSLVPCGVCRGCRWRCISRILLIAGPARMKRRVYTTAAGFLLAGLASCGHVTCSRQACAEGTCMGVCFPGATQCSGNDVETCDESGQWDSAAACVSSACSAGACAGECAPGATQCTGNGANGSATGNTAAAGGSASGNTGNKGGVGATAYWGSAGSALVSGGGGDAPWAMNSSTLGRGAGGGGAGVVMVVTGTTTNACN
jgi:hypothetical protein